MYAATYSRLYKHSFVPCGACELQFNSSSELLTPDVSSPVGRVSCNEKREVILITEERFVPCGACELQLKEQ